MLFHLYVPHEWQINKIKKCKGNNDLEQCTSQSQFSWFSFTWSQIWSWMTSTVFRFKILKERAIARSRFIRSAQKTTCILQTNAKPWQDASKILIHGLTTSLSSPGRDFLPTKIRLQVKNVSQMRGLKHRPRSNDRKKWFENLNIFSLFKLAS